MPRAGSRCCCRTRATTWFTRRVREETGEGALAAVGLAQLADRHPRDLSGGEKQRLALAIVLGDPTETDAPAVVGLDEPTRGMDRAAKDALVRLLSGLDSAVIVATHDPEFAAAFADRVVLLADGRVIADGTRSRGALRRHVLRHRGRAHPRRSRRRAASVRGRRAAARSRGRGAGVSWQLAAFAILALGLFGGLRLV